MYERVLQKFRASIRSLNYIVPLHADEEMDEDGLSVFDLENVVLTGAIVERQRDSVTREWKYLVRGPGLDDVNLVVVGKLSVTGRLVIITVYRD